MRDYTKYITMYMKQHKLTNTEILLLRNLLMIASTTNTSLQDLDKLFEEYHLQLGYPKNKSKQYEQKYRRAMILVKNLQEYILEYPEDLSYENTNVNMKRWVRHILDPSTWKTYDTTETDWKEVGKRMKNKREENKITITRMSQLIGHTISTLYTKEKGKGEMLKYVKKYSKALHVNLDYLLTGVDK